MENFDLMQKICEKIASTAIEIGDMDVAISSFQDRGYSKTAELYVEMQLTELEQLQKLTLFLTGLLIPDASKKDDKESKDDDKEQADDTLEDTDKGKNEPPKEIIARKMRTTRAVPERTVPVLPVSRKAGYEHGKRSK